MKVAYNACFGGFSLSPIALTAFAKKKGIELTWYKGREELTRLEGMGEAAWDIQPATSNLGDVITDEVFYKHFYYPEFYDNEDRCDPDLIAVIEELGDEANGMCAKLAIKEVPDGADFEITEYDGFEDVEPPRMSW